MENSVEPLRIVQRQSKCNAVDVIVVSHCLGKNSEAKNQNWNYHFEILETFISFSNERKLQTAWFLEYIEMKLKCVSACIAQNIVQTKMQQ